MPKLKNKRMDILNNTKVISIFLLFRSQRIFIRNILPKDSSGIKIAGILSPTLFISAQSPSFAEYKGNL